MQEYLHNIHFYSPQELSNLITMNKRKDPKNYEHKNDLNDNFSLQKMSKHVNAKENQIPRKNLSSVKHSISLQTVFSITLKDLTNLHDLPRRRK